VILALYKLVLRPTYWLTMMSSWSSWEPPKLATCTFWETFPNFRWNISLSYLFVSVTSFRSTTVNTNVSIARFVRLLQRYGFSVVFTERLLCSNRGQL